MLVDGKPSVAGERDGILQGVGGMACKADELMAKKKDEGREFVKDKRVVYIYHNTVDAVGDDGQTEGEDVRGRAAGHRRTGGPGRLHRQQPERPSRRRHGRPRLPVHRNGSPAETDKSKLEEKPDGTVLAKKRYLLGHASSRPRCGLARQDEA